MGAQGSLLRSIIAGLVPRDKRGTGFGLFDTAFGTSWFAGSWLVGILYERSLTSLVVFSVVLQFIALPIFVIANGRRRTTA